MKAKKFKKRALKVLLDRADVKPKEVFFILNSILGGVCERQEAFLRYTDYTEAEYLNELRKLCRQMIKNFDDIQQD